MSYRSIKRVLGETSIERKCRLLFIICLTCLVTGAFTFVDMVAEDLVLKTTRSKARDLIDILLLRRHFEKWDTQQSDEWMKSVSRDFVNTEYDYEVIAPNDGVEIALAFQLRGPKDSAEEAILKQLKEKFDSQLAEERKLAEGQNSTDARPAMDPKTKAPALPGAPSAAGSFLASEDVFYDQYLPDEDEYQYYAPVRWKMTCTHCHQSLFNAGVVPASEAATADSRQLPFRAVMVVLPYKETQSAINRARAMLMAVGFVTVFIAAVVLYIIVRYVVVKPLKHLRDVSDDISRGKVETRAEIRTGDEFQELANSFNRMLRHLTETQADLQRVNAELDAKVDELAHLNMQLYEMNRLKGDFLANMSHELRTPLNSIIGFSEVLQGIDALNDKQKRYAQNIQKSGRVLLEMINDILDLAKVEAGKMEVRPTEFSIDAIVQVQCDMVRSLSEEKNIDLAVSIAPDLPLLYQDQGKIQQILTNLLSNAIKFTPEGGRITVTARPDGMSRLELTVADTGVGIAPEDRDIIFEKFRQGKVVVGEDGLTRRYSGTGLGLSIVRELCKLLGGEVTVDSEIGKGSAFKVVIPWSRAELPRSETPLNAKLDELTKPHWPEHARGAESPSLATSDSGR
ncbi:MAG TPA: HAMP domain-containing sensor histidine kinase [Pirellulaceae bacterium]|nr:HAMP domain-containing sensor histidine kinase [Pirellulaceae bacterium]